MGPAHGSPAISAFHTWATHRVAPTRLVRYLPIGERLWRKKSRFRRRYARPSSRLIRAPFPDTLTSCLFPSRAREARSYSPQNYLFSGKNRFSIHRIIPKKPNLRRACRSQSVSIDPAFMTQKNIASIDNRVSINRLLDPSSPCQRPKRSTRPARSSPSTSIERGKTKQKRHNMHTVYILIPRFTDVLAHLAAFYRCFPAISRRLLTVPAFIRRQSASAGQALQIA